jgi:hypothetical protein
MSLKIKQAYLLRWSKPISKHVKPQYGDRMHYFGATSNVDETLARHVKIGGDGSQVTTLARVAGNQIELVGVFDFSHYQLFQRHGFRTFCMCDMCKRILAWGDETGDYVI